MSKMKRFLDDQGYFEQLQNEDELPTLSEMVESPRGKKYLEAQAKAEKPAGKVLDLKNKDKEAA